MRRLMTLFIALLATTMTIAAPTKSGYLEVNGVNYYYEIRGKIGPPTSAADAASGATNKAAPGATKETQLPLLLLHGGMGSIDMFGPLLPTLAKTRKVIAVDMHGHGTHRARRPFAATTTGRRTWRS